MAKSPLYQRRHFKAEAELIKMIPSKSKRQKVAMERGKIFERSNKQFDWTRFLKACGL
jgi:hypothetical protein